MLPGIINEKENCLDVRDDISEKKLFDTRMNLLPLVQLS